MCLCGWATGDGLAVTFAQPLGDEAPERSASALERPPQVLLAAAAEGELPGVAGEPAVLGDEVSVRLYARCGPVAADAKYDASRIDAGVRRLPRDVPTHILAGDPVVAARAGDDALGGRALIDGPARVRGMLLRLFS